MLWLCRKRHGGADGVGVGTRTLQRLSRSWYILRFGLFLVRNGINPDFIGFLGRDVAGMGGAGGRTGGTRASQRLRCSWYVLSFGTLSIDNVINPAIMGFHNILLVKVSYIDIVFFA